MLYSIPLSTNSLIFILHLYRVCCITWFIVWHQVRTGSRHRLVLYIIPASQCYRMSIKSRCALWCQSVEILIFADIFCQMKGNNTAVNFFTPFIILHVMVKYTNRSIANIKVKVEQGQIVTLITCSMCFHSLCICNISSAKYIKWNFQKQQWMLALTIHVTWFFYGIFAIH